MRKLMPAISLALALLFLIGGLSFAQAPADDFKLPGGTIKISDAIPAMGEHWARPQDLPLGPIFTVWQGKVIGVEYMFKLDMMKGPVTPPGTEEIIYQIPDLSLYGQRIDHLTFTYMANGHEGFEVPHYDIHLYFISPADRYKIILNVPPPPNVTGTPAAEKPADAINLSPVIPAMGEHWANPQQLPLGPIYLVHKGKTIGVEYMPKHKNMPCRKVGPPGAQSFQCGIDSMPVGQRLNHMTVEYLPKGHAGYEEWHFDLHLYNITPQERAAIAP